MKELEKIAKDNGICNNLRVVIILSNHDWWSSRNDNRI